MTIRGNRRGAGWLCGLCRHKYEAHVFGSARAAKLFRQPLFRLLAINLAIGVTAAALMLGGLLALNPHRLRDLIAADRAPLTALGLLLFGFVVTFGSVAMGTAIMAIGRGDGSGGKPKSDPLPVHVRGRASTPAGEAGPS